MNEFKSFDQKPNIQNEIDLYLQARKSYFEKTYPGFVDQMLEGERDMIETSRKDGYLANWQPGMDILVCITENIQKSATTESGSINAGENFKSNNFSCEIFNELEKAKDKADGYFLVSMNEGKTVSTKDVENGEVTILSPGQGGCTNVVVAGKDRKGELIVSVNHFSPIKFTLLVDSLVRERQKYNDVTITKVVIFISPGIEQNRLDMLTNTIKLFPNSTVELKSIDLTQLKDNILRVSANKNNGEIDIKMTSEDLKWKMN